MPVNLKSCGKLQIILLPLQSLHTKLNSLLGVEDTSSVIKSAVLYDGSITKYDSRLHGFDIATCLEVLGFSFFTLKLLVPIFFAFILFLI